MGDGIEDPGLILGGFVGGTLPTVLTITGDNENIALPSASHVLIQAGVPDIPGGTVKVTLTVSAATLGTSHRVIKGSDREAPLVIILAANAADDFIFAGGGHNNLELGSNGNNGDYILFSSIIANDWNVIDLSGGWFPA